MGEGSEMIGDILQSVAIVLIGISHVYFVIRFTKALGLRADWKRRFDKMREILGL